MIIWGIAAWWYTEGIRQCLQRAKSRLEATLDYFSIDLLLRTLFSPFRQISAGRVDGPLDVQVRAFFDQLISRCIGMFVRLLMIIIGSITIVVSLVSGLTVIIFWAFVPLIPLIGLALFLSGWMPWSQ